MPKNNSRPLDAHLIAEWHPARNGKLDPKQVPAKSNKKVWWKCSQGHEWQAQICNRTIGKGCPVCSGRLASKDNNLSTKSSNLVTQWHPTRNGALRPDNIMPKSDKRVWWRCQQGHEWEATVKNRSFGNGCPYCSGQKVGRDNSLAYLFPSVTREWHPTKNGDLRPDAIAAHSSTKVWWLCTSRHEWETEIYHRTDGKDSRNCPYCSKRISKSSAVWLDGLNIKLREHLIRVERRRFFVDGFDPDKRTIYEFLGDYWHGNPKIYKPDDINPHVRQTYGELFRRTMDKFDTLRRAGYMIIYRWEGTETNEIFKP